MENMDYSRGSNDSMDYLRYRYDWHSLCGKYQKFNKIVELSDGAYLQDFRSLDGEYVCCFIRFYLDRKPIGEISFRSEYGRDIIQDFKKQIKDLHKESSGQFVGGLPYVSFSDNPTYFWRLMNQDSCNPIYHKFDVDEYNEQFDTYYITVAEAVLDNPNVLFYEEEIESSFLY